MVFRPRERLQNQAFAGGNTQQIAHPKKRKFALKRKVPMILSSDAPLTLKSWETLLYLMYNYSFTC